MTRFKRINKKENEIVSEFDTRFDKLHNQIPRDVRPIVAVVCIIYFNSFEGYFGFIIRDGKPHTLAEAKEYSEDIEENIVFSNFDHFQYPHDRTEPKEKKNYKQCTRSNFSHTSET
jgi:hypothetical protein